MIVRNKTIDDEIQNRLRLSISLKTQSRRKKSIESRKIPNHSFEIHLEAENENEKNKKKNEMK